MAKQILSSEALEVLQALKERKAKLTQNVAIDRFSNSLLAFEDGTRKSIHWGVLQELGVPNFTHCYWDSYEDQRVYYVITELGVKALEGRVTVEWVGLNDLRVTVDGVQS